MNLSAKAEYACLAMAELAVRHERGLPTSLKEIAEQFKISHPFLMQIFLQLKAARLVRSLRGSTGGYQLARPPETIFLVNIVDAIDGPPKQTTALDALPDRPLVRSLAKIWREVGEAARQVVEEISLGELLRRTRTTTSLDFQI